MSEEVTSVGEAILKLFLDAKRVSLKNVNVMQDAIGIHSLSKECAASWLQVENTGNVSRDSVVHSTISVLENVWHMRLGHAHIGSIRKLHSTGAVVGLHLSHPREKGAPCESCIAGKLTKRVAKLNPIRASSVGDVVHSDVCGPMACASVGGSKYCVTFIDEHSGYIHVVPIKLKSDVAAAFRKFHLWFERKFGCVVKCLHSDGGGEYLALNHYLQERGIEFESLLHTLPQIMELQKEPVEHLSKLCALR